MSEKNEVPPLMENEDITKDKKVGSLNVLCREIEDGIKGLKTREEGERIIALIKKGHNDENVYATKLFECYTNIASTLAHEKSKNISATDDGQRVDTDNSSSDVDDIELMREVPEYLYQGTGKVISGWDALKRNIFWIRLAMMIICLVSFSVMESLPHVNQDVVSSNMLLSEECRIQSQFGMFSYKSYAFVGIIGIITWIYALLFCLYYLIPADQQERKYIPASPLYLLPLRWGKIILFERKECLRYVEVFLDGALFLLCLWAAISAAVSIDHSEVFNSYTLWYVQCAYGLCNLGGCIDEEGVCKGCDNGVCSDGSCANEGGFCDNDCEDVYRCLDGSCPNQFNVCEYGEDGKIVVRTRTGPDFVYYSLQTFVDTYSALSSDCIDHNPLAVIKASVALMFMASFLLLVALQISLRSLYLEKMRRDVESGKKSLPLADDSSHA